MSDRKSSRRTRGTTPPPMADDATRYVLDVVQRQAVAGDVDALESAMHAITIRDWPVDALLEVFAAMMHAAPPAKRDAIVESVSRAAAAATDRRRRAELDQVAANDRLDRWMAVGLQLRQRDGDRFARVRELVEQLVASPASAEAAR